MKLKCPVPRILIPIDGSEHSKQAVQFAGCLGASLGKSLSSITLLNVTGGSYLSPLSSIDLRAKVLDKPETLAMIRDTYIQENIIPLMEEGEKILRDSGIKIEIGRLLVDGKPGDEILRVADKDKVSTIIMARRGLSELKGFFLGSVTSKVVHAATRQTLYIVGHSVPEKGACPVSRILIPVDGSSHSMKGVEHAACLISSLKASFSKVTLLRVIDLELVAAKLQAGIIPDDEAAKILDKARELLVQAGLSEKLITVLRKTGNPAEEILKEAEAGYDLIIMGRKGRTALKDLVLGGVSSTVLHRTDELTIAIMSSE